MARRKHIRRYDEPIRHPDHPRPRSRRQFLAQGFISGSGLVLGGMTLSLGSGRARADVPLAPDLAGLLGACGIATQGNGKIPFICFDLAGGSSQAGSHVLVGQGGGQLDFLTTQGYSTQGLPGDMVPPIVNPTSGTNDFINTQLGLAFHSDSAFLRGILERVTDPAVLANISGAVIPARSENDSGNNPHNPMYGIGRAGAKGSLLQLIGSQATDSGGNSMAPLSLMQLATMDPRVDRPTKVDRPSDVTGLVDVGDLTTVLTQQDAVAVMESIYRISDKKMQNADAGQVSLDDVVKDLVRCGYLKSTDLAARFGDPTTLDPANDPEIVGASGIFSAAEFAAESEFRKTASVMKMVINGFAGAGTIEMGGFDYHGGKRAQGEVTDLRAGRCMGAVLQYAATRGVPVMMYVFSDGSLSSNGVIDDSVDGRGKGEWTSDNQTTAAPFFLVYNPSGRAQLLGGSVAEQARHQQIGYMRPDGSVETASTPAANNVNLLAYTVVLNYMALHGEQGNFSTLFPNNGLGANATALDNLTAFAPIVNGTITNPA